MSIGEVSLLSQLGEPLRVEVGLKLRRKEKVTNICLFLLPADIASEISAGGFPLNDLTAKLSESGLKVEIQSNKSFNELFAVFRLQIKCPGFASVTRTLSLLPELKPEPPVDIPLLPVPAATVPVLIVPVTTAVTHIKNTSEQSSVSTPVKHPVAARAKIPRAKAEPIPILTPSEEKAPGNGQFMLKLSGEPLDISSIGSISAEEREHLLARQKLLDDGDDQTARYLAMQNQVKLMQDELITVKLKLSLLEVSTPSGVPVQLGPVQQPEHQQLYLLIFLGFLLTVVLAWLFFRQKIRPSALFSEIAETAILHEPVILKPKPVEPGVFKPENSHREIPHKHPKIEKIIKPINEILPKPIEETVKPVLSEEETLVLEEAELYSVYNHPDKATRILNEFIETHPNSEKSWMLLLSIYLSNGQADEYEKAARGFQQHNKNSPSWRMFQALGRTLDNGNPLYIDEGDPASFAPLFPYLFQHKHRPIGEILIELGHLSQQDLTNCLKDFDSKQHGRFGVFLVKRRQITHAQLNEALLKQSGGDEVSPPSESMPTLQQVEDLLKDFNPQRDGSVEEYLNSHKDNVIEKFARPVETMIVPAVPEPEVSLDAMLDFDWDMTSIPQKTGEGDNSELLEFELTHADSTGKSALSLS